MTTRFHLLLARAIVRAALASLILLSAGPAAHAETQSKRVRFDVSDAVPVTLVVDGVEISTIRFSVEGSIKLNPFKSGKGPQAFLAVRNTGARAFDFGVAVVLYDEKGAVLAASESNHLGDLEPGEDGEIDVMFRYVKRRVSAAKTVEVILETLPPS